MAESATTTTQDEDEKELIESIGDDVAQPKAEEDEDDAPAPKAQETTDDEPTPAEGDADTVAGDSGSDPAADEPGSGAGDVATPAPAGDGSNADPAVPPLVQLAAAGADPEPAKPVKPQQSPAARRIGEIEAVLTAPDYDRYSDEAEKLRFEHARLSAYVAAEPIANNQFWISESVSHGLPRANLENIWQGITSQYAKDYPDTDPELWRISAQRDYKNAVIAAKGTRKPAATASVAAPVKPKTPVAAPTPITPKGARVAPPAAAVPPPPKARSDEEELVDSVRREVKSGVRV